MKQYEYKKHINPGKKTQISIEWLNEQGDFGWKLIEMIEREYCGIHSTTCLFIRETENRFLEKK
jgi:hypothetical protein